MKDYLAGEQVRRCHHLQLFCSVWIAISTPRLPDLAVRQERPFLVSVPSSVMRHHLLCPHPGPLPTTIMPSSGEGSEVT